MRIVVLCSSLYSETGCAMVARLARLGYVPAGALALRTLERGTLLRKLGQWGLPRVVHYARTKLLPHRGDRHAQLQNPYLEPVLRHRDGVFCNLREVAAFYGFPVAVCNDQNATGSIAQLRKWSPDLIIFTGGNILREQLLALPRLGVLNVHLGLLPEVRGMSTPEWSLLNQIPVGITVHYMDVGIDTGPVLQKYEFPDAARCESLSDLRNRLIALGVSKIGDVISGLDRGAIAATPQSDPGQDIQFFVMHEWLQARAAERLTKSRPPVVAGMVDE